MRFAAVFVFGCIAVLGSSCGVAGAKPASVQSPPFSTAIPRNTAPPSSPAITQGVPTWAPQPSTLPAPQEGTPTPSLARTAPGRTDIPGNPNWQLVFSEEFDSRELVLSRWNTSLRWGRKNSPELQYYAEDTLNFQDGLLRIRADRREMENRSYTSGVVASFDRYSFAYGYIEMRARLPAGQGLWPAFWLLPQDENSHGEIDVMENLGDDPRRIYNSLHWAGGGPKSEVINNDYVGPDFSKDFHTFAVRWDSSMVVWYVDGVERFRVTENVPKMPMYLIANLAIGGEWPGNPDSTTVFPAFFDIDYIRVYQLRQ